MKNDTALHNCSTTTAEVHDSSEPALRCAYIAFDKSGEPRLFSIVLALAPCVRRLAMSIK